jgi:hypothetical protein
VCCVLLFDVDVTHYVLFKLSKIITLGRPLCMFNSFYIYFLKEIKELNTSSYVSLPPLDC